MRKLDRQKARGRETSEGVILPYIGFRPPIGGIDSVLHQ